MTQSGRLSPRPQTDHVGPGGGKAAYGTRRPRGTDHGARRRGDPAGPHKPAHGPQEGQARGGAVGVGAARPVRAPREASGGGAARAPHLLAPGDRPPVRGHAGVAWPYPPRRPIGPPHPFEGPACRGLSAPPHRRPPAVTYFQNHPQRYTQHRYPRRGGGYTAPQITLHTYEAPHTRSLQDAARWLTQRRDPGSYHALAGARGPRDVLLLAPWSHETWHSVPSNNWSIGISAVAYAHQWKTIPRAAADNLVKSMAYAASLAAKWLEQAHGRKVEPRVLTRAQAMRKESGFVTHATMDPGRRTDPGRDFPMGDFLAEFNRLMTPTPAIPKGLTVDQADRIIKHIDNVFNQRIKLPGSSAQAFRPG